MVNPKHWLCLLLLGVLTSSCGLWGGRPPENKIIQYQAPPSSCTGMETLLTDSPEIALKNFDCWSREIQSLWNDVQGQKKDFLSDAELRLLLRKKIIQIENQNPDHTLELIFAIRNFLGLPEGVSRSDLEDWLEWTRSRLPRIQIFYRKHILFQGRFSYVDFEDGANLVADLFERIPWRWSPEQLSHWIGFVFNRPKSSLALVRAGLDGLAAICPQPGAPNHFVPREVASCLRDFSEKFRGGSEWFDLVLNPIEKPPHVVPIRESLDRLQSIIPQWFQNPNLDPLHTDVWIQLGRTLGYEPPSDLSESLKLVKKFEPGSNPEKIRPILAVKIFEVIHEQQKIFLEGLPYYQDFFDRKRCVNSKTASTWSNCVLPSSTANPPLPVQLALRLRSPHYGTQISPIDGKQFEKFSLYYALSAVAIRAFDADGDGLISASSKDTLSNEVVQLIRTLVQSVQSLDRWISGLRQGIEEDDILVSEKFELPSHLNPRGFAQLITFVGSEILVRRTPEERNFFGNLVSLISNNFPKGTIHLDRLALTALLTHVDLLPEFRQAYLSGGYVRREPGRGPRDWLIHREDVIRNLGTLLKDHFPRTLASCQAKGYGCSCEIAFDEILPPSDFGDSMIPAENLDLMNIVLWGFEGVLDSCDRDSDQKLSFQLLNGDDELDCALTHIKDIVSRLMEANVIPNHPQAKFLLQFLNSVSVTRAFGKASLARGDKRLVLINPLLLPFHRKATLGSMYSLLSDILNSDRLTEARQRKCASNY